MSYRKKHIKPKIKNLRKKKPVFKTPLFWICVASFILIITVVYFLFFSPMFQVAAIGISGNQKIKSSDIENTAWNSVNKKILTFSYKSIFMANSAEIVKNVAQAFPVIENVQVQKKLPKNIVLKITERKPYAVFCGSEDINPGSCFLLDENGIIFESIENIMEDDFVIIDAFKHEGIKPGEKVIEKNTMDAIVNIQKDLKNNFYIDSRRVLIGNPLVVTTSENWRVYFNPDLDIELQIKKMNALLKDEIAEDKRKDLQYIYLQYKDRAYYK